MLFHFRRYVESKPTLHHAESFVRNTAPTADSTWVEIVLDEFRILFSEDGLMGVTIVEGQAYNTVAMMLGGFLVPSFSALLLSTRKPYSRALAKHELEVGKKVLHPSFDNEPRPAALEAASQGLHLHFFALGWVGCATGQESMRHRSALGMSFADTFAGMPLRLITVEATGEPGFPKQCGTDLVSATAIPTWCLVPENQEPSSCRLTLKARI